MEQMISAADANRHFSRVLRGVREGESYVVTSHGKPVARILPAAHGVRDRERAREMLFSHLQRQPIVDIGPWTRDELYEDGA